MVIAELESVLEGLNILDALREQDTASVVQGEIDKDEVALLLRELRDQLVGGDLRSGEILEKLAPKLSGTEFAETFDGIAQAVDGYDFDSALAQLDELVGEIDV